MHRPGNQTYKDTGSPSLADEWLELGWARWFTCKELECSRYTPFLRDPKHVRLLQLVQPRVYDNRLGPLVPAQWSLDQTISFATTICVIPCYRKKRWIEESIDAIWQMFHILFPSNVACMLDKIQISRQTWKHVEQICAARGREKTEPSKQATYIIMIGPEEFFVHWWVA